VPAKVHYRAFWGAEKLKLLKASLDPASNLPSPDYVTMEPSAADRFSLRPAATGATYAAWPTVTELANHAPQNGLMEKRGGALLDDDRAALAARMQSYFDAGRSFDAVMPLIGALGTDFGGFEARSVRDLLSQKGGFRDDALRRYWLRAFDTPWAYVVETAPLWNRSRPALQAAAPDARGFLVSRPAAVCAEEGFVTAWTPLLGDNDALRGHAYYIPVVENFSGRPRPNLSGRVRSWLNDLGLAADEDAADHAWRHALAITYSPAYLAENADGIRLGWPRVPLPGRADPLRASAALGARLAALLDTETPVPGVTEGDLAPALAPIAVPATQPGAGRDWALRGWGSKDKRGAVMPGQGRVTPRPYSAEEAATAAEAAVLGTRTLDVGMNGASFWRNIPEAVWEARIGGYQVLKKWLSYRDRSILGRELNEGEVTHVQASARRLAAILLLGPELDASYRACAVAHRPLPGDTES
jgi:hypothetical protein